MDDLDLDAQGQSEPETASDESGLSWCVSCQAEYLSHIADCPVCEAPLQSGRRASVEELAPEAEDKLAYEFHEWSVESRVMMESLLVSAGVVHAWQGTTLMVREEDEDAVDVVVEEVELATLPTINLEAELVAFATGDWSGEQQTTVIGALVAEEIPHAFDDQGDLVIEATDKGTVEVIASEVLAGTFVPADQADRSGEPGEAGVGIGGVSDADAEEEYTFGDEPLQGLEAQELLGELFVASNRMAKNPRHPKSVETVLDRADSVQAAALPFGFERATWRSIVDTSQVIRDQIIENTADEEELMEAAAELCKVLRPYV